MTTILGVVIGILLVDLPRLAHEEGPLRDRVAFKVNSLREDYRVGETLSLRLVFENFSDSTLHMQLTPELRDGVTDIYFRRQGAPEYRLLKRLPPSGPTRSMPAHRIVKLGPGETYSYDLKVGYDQSTDLPFLNEAGNYNLRIEYVAGSGPNARLVSNDLQVSVADVALEDRSALEAYRAGLAFFADFEPGIHDATPALIEAAASFMERFRGSPYWSDVRRGLWPALGERVRFDLASEQEKIWFHRMRREWGEDTAPPRLTLVASPAELWPPNHKLVPISIALSVRDDGDPNPIIKLVSITCDDQCNPTIDIGNAVVDTDDRNFDLRSERLGSGAGRSYTITYSAEDSSGNKTTGTTLVTVPHDKGKKK